MPELDGKQALPEELKTSQPVPAQSDEDRADLRKNLLAQLKKMVPIIFGLSGSDPNAVKEKLLAQVGSLVKNPGQFSEDFLDSLFGTGADGISREDDVEKKGKIDFTLELPEPVRMVRIHPFSYQMFEDEELKTADLYIVPDSQSAQYQDWFVPDRPGTPVFDPETGLVIAGDWFLYQQEGTEAEPYRLYLGAGSVHLEDGLAEKAAELLLSVDNAIKEETP
jgi:hypothetical protein